VISELKDVGFTEIGRQKRLCGVGGTIRATRMLYNEIMGLSQENAELEVAGVERLIRLFEEDQRAFYRHVLQLAPERIHTILPGMLILSTIAKACDAEKITVSGNGVREGYLFDRVLRL
jgi:exopolyphosphatase/guanosine-5'-triphosphate,3'-diphosphate pyrophosphatase